MFLLKTFDKKKVSLLTLDRLLANDHNSFLLLHVTQTSAEGFCLQMDAPALPNSVINMTNAFSGITSFPDITNLEVGNVKYMSGLFRNSKFNQDISGWAVSSVITASTNTSIIF